MSTPIKLSDANRIVNDPDLYVGVGDFLCLAPVGRLRARIALPIIVAAGSFGNFKSKLASEGAARVCELRNRDTSRSFG